MKYTRSFFRLTLALCCVAFCVFVYALSPSLAAPQINNQINYQARLLDASGFPVADGNYSVYLSLYDSSVGGTRLWTATGTTAVPTPLTVYVQNGLFTVLLGDTSLSGGSQNTLDTVDWNSDQIYLGVTINADAEMSPRKRFASAPQAFNARQLQGMYASSTASGGQTLFTFNQTENNAATGTRSTLDIRSAGTSNTNDFLLRGINDVGSVVFTVNRAGSVTSSNLYVGGNLDVVGTADFSLLSTSTPITISAPSPAASDYTSVLSYSTTGTEGLLLANYNLFGSVNNTVLTFTKDLSDPFNSANGKLSYANEFNTLSLGITGSSALNGTLLELFDNDYMTPGFAGDAAMVLRKYTNSVTSSMMHLWNLGSNPHDVTINVGSADPIGLVDGKTGSIYFRNSSTSGTQAYLNTGGTSATWVGVATVDMLGSGGSSTDTLATVTSRGATTTATLSLYGGFLAASSSVTGTLTVVGSSTALGNAYVGTSTYAVPLNSLFAVNGDDLYVQGNIGSVSSVYTNGAFVAGTGTTMFGNGFISHNNGAFNVSTTGNFTVDVGGNVINLGTSSAFINFAGRLFSNILPNFNNTYDIGDPGLALANIYSVNVSSTNLNTDELTVARRLSVPSRVPAAAVGSTPLSGVGSAYSLFLQGKYAYVANAGNDSLDVIDYSIPSSPTSVASVAAGLDPISVMVDGNYAYLLNQNGDSLMIYDVTDPSNPILLSSTLTANDPVDVKIQGKFAYVFSQAASTLEVFDISNPFQVVLVGSVATIANPAAAFVQGRFAYVAGFFSGLEIFDLSNPAAPISVGTTSTGNGTLDIAVQGRYAYVVNVIDNTLQIIDVVNPSSPVGVGVVSTASNPYGIAVQGRNAFVTSNGGNLLEIYDVADPTAPVNSGSVTTALDPTGVFVQGLYAAVVANGSGNLEIFDVSDAYIQQLEVGGLAVNDLSVRGDFQGQNAFLSGGLSVARSGRFSGGLSVTGTTQLMQDTYVGASLYPGGLNPLFTMNGNDLFVQGNIGSVSSVYTNGAFVAGAASTFFGDGFVSSNINNFTYSSVASHDFYANSSLVATFGYDGIQLNSNKNGLGGGGDIDLNAASALPATNFNGGNISIDAGAGDGTGAGGQIDIRAGNSNSAIFTAGTVNVYGGNGQFGGQAYLNGGTGSVGFGGDTIVRGGNGNTVGGSVSITGGDGTMVGGGSIYLSPGAGPIPGSIYIQPDTALTASTNVLFREASTVYAVGLRAPNVMSGSVNFILPGADGASSTVIGTNGSGALSFVSVCLTDGTNCPPSGSATPTLALLGSYDTVPAEYYYDVAVANNIMYAIVGPAFTPARMDIFDISDPALPVLLRSISIPSSSYHVRIEGDRLFVSGSSSGIYVYDITEPTFPVFYGFVTTSGFPGQFFVSGDRLYAANSNLGLQIYSLASNNPRLLGTYATTSINSVYVVGDIAYTANGSDGLGVIDVSNPAAPVRLGGIAASSTNDVFVSGNYAYLADGTSGVKIINIATSTSPTLVGSYDPLVGFETATDIFAAGDFLYFNAFDGGFYVADISNPASPVFVDNIDFGPSNIVNFDIGGSYAYLAADVDGIRIVDLGGTKLASANIDLLNVNKLDVDGSVHISNNLSLHGGLSVGFGGIRSLGTLSVSASSTSATVSIVNRTATSTNAWGAYIDQLIVGTNQNATGASNYNMVITYASSATFGGLCIDDTATGATCPSNVGASIMADGAVISNAFDLAEIYSVTGTYDVGDVLTLNTTSSMTVQSSPGIAYDSKIIGVVSENPGFLLGWTEGAKVALAGRVPVKISMNNGPIQIGDALTSSDVPGHAMKATKPGMILGYALENASATGTVELFVNVSYWAALALGEDGSIRVDNNGNVSVMNDLMIGGRLFPSLKGGGIQTDWYLFVNADDPTSTYISTNADGWMSMDTYDFAERYYSPDELEPGDLVIVSQSGSMHVQRSWNEDDMLLGIVSTRPAFIAGRPATSTYPIALSGRVPTKVSTMNGAIKAGDPLAPTSIPGVAAKAVQSGPIVGLALEDYDLPQIDKIEVYVNPSYWVNEQEASSSTAVVSQTVVSQSKQGFATIVAGSTKVRIEFPSLGAYPNVQVTPRGSVSGGWWTDSYSDTGFEIMLGSVEDHDVIFAWRVEPTSGSDVMRMSDGTYSVVDPLTGAPVGLSATTTTNVIAEPIVQNTIESTSSTTEIIPEIAPETSP